MRPDSSRFRLWHSVDVRFKDIDFGGHAHHSQALVYFEEARARYWKDVVGRGDPEQVDFILADAKIRYHSRVFYPLSLSVGVRVSSLGKKHFVMEYLARDPNGVDLVSGETTQVMYDYDKKATMCVPQEVKDVIKGWEGQDL